MTYQPKAGSGSQTTIPSIIDVAWRHFGVDLYRPGEGPPGPTFPEMSPHATFKSDQPPHQMPDQDLNTASQQTDGTYSPAPNEIVYVCSVCYYNCASKALPNNMVTCALKGLIDTLVILSPAQAEMYFSNKADFLYNCARTFITCGVILLELSEPIAATMEELRSRPESYDQMIRRFEMERNDGHISMPIPVLP